MCRFYQADAARDGRLCLFFAALRLAMQRAFAAGPERIRLVDLGPTRGTENVALKGRFGFSARADWQEQYREGGEFSDPALARSLLGKELRCMGDQTTTSGSFS